jgi:uncharacterized protein (TIGR02246 family)
MHKAAALMLVAVPWLGMACARRADRSKEQDALLATDRAWSQVSSAGKNADSVLAYWAEDARVVIPGAPMLSGKAAIRQMVTSSLATPGFHISWTPEAATVASSGDLGYTIGSTEVTAPDASGKVSTMQARYVEVWVKGPDGQWRCIEDVSSPTS